MQIIFEVISTTAQFTCEFDTVVLNIGGGWVSASSAFVAPQAGIYYLSFSYGSPPNATTQIAIDVCKDILSRNVIVIITIIVKFVILNIENGG